MAETKPKIVTMGGGTGTFVTLSGLKQFPVDLTALVSVADSGGSTGRLRDEFGFLPVGDLRQALAALAKEEENAMIRELLLYRFSKGSGLEGHNLGNLILTALQDMTNSTARAVELASKIFDLHGHIFPITTKDIQLVIEYEDGTVEIGEHVLDEPKHGGKKIVNLKTSPRANLYKEAERSLMNADLIIIGPGDMYGSIIPTLVVDGIKPIFKKTKAKIVYILNLMTRYSQTHEMTAKDHVTTMEQYLGKEVDTIIANDQSIPSEILERYEAEHEYPIKMDLDLLDREVIMAPLLKRSVVKKHATDSVPRSFLRHDPEKLAKTIIKLVE